MPDRIKPPLTLSGKNVDLISLDEIHLPKLKETASEKRIWEFYIVNCSMPEIFDREYHDAIVEMEKGTQFPFVIFHKIENKLIGSTRLLDLQPKHRKLEIGWTWLHPDYWATSINTECKLLLLKLCFEELNAVRVQFRSDENNLRSRKAIEKMGSKFEGIIRNDMQREDGSQRNSACYSIIEEEWTDVKLRLNEKINKFSE